jgi:hypothetical protein
LAPGEPDDAEAGAGAAGTDRRDPGFKERPPPFQEAHLHEGALATAGKTETEVA